MNIKFYADAIRPTKRMKVESCSNERQAVNAAGSRDILEGLGTLCIGTG